MAYSTFLFSGTILLQAPPIQLYPLSSFKWPADLIWGWRCKQIHKHFTNITVSNCKHEDKTQFVYHGISQSSGGWTNQTILFYFFKVRLMWRETSCHRNEGIYYNIICKRVKIGRNLPAMGNNEMYLLGNLKGRWGWKCVKIKKENHYNAKRKPEM